METTSPIFNNPLYTGVNENISTKKRGELDRDAFLRLLITQLKNQDPLNPMKDQEFIAQLATFSSLEQLNNLNKGMDKMTSQAMQQNLLTAVSMIGREVATTDGRRGIVSSVVTADNDIRLRVGEDSVSLSTIKEIRK